MKNRFAIFARERQTNNARKAIIGYLLLDIGSHIRLRGNSTPVGIFFVLDQILEVIVSGRIALVVEVFANRYRTGVFVIRQTDMLRDNILFRSVDVVGIMLQEINPNADCFTSGE